jgi:hypothetical protein
LLLFLEHNLLLCNACRTGGKEYYMYIKIDIGQNLIKKEDTTLRVLSSRGCLDYCATWDGKRFYILSTTRYQLDFKFMQPNTPRDQELLIRYIASASSPRKTATGEMVYPFPASAPDAGQEKWYSLQVGAEIDRGDMVIKSDRDGQIIYLMSLVESRALQVWRRNPSRIGSMEAALDYLSTIDRTAARLYKRARWGTSEREIQRRAKIADAEELAEAKAYESAMAEIDRV